MERGSVPILAIRPDAAAVSGDDPVANTESHPHSLAHLFGGEKGVKNLSEVFSRDAGAVVRDGYSHTIAHSSGLDDKDSSAMGFGHGELGISNEVQKHRLYLTGISGDHWKVLRKFRFDIDVVYVEFI